MYHTAWPVLRLWYGAIPMTMCAHWPRVGVKNSSSALVAARGTTEPLSVWLISSLLPLSGSLWSYVCTMPKPSAMLLPCVSSVMLNRVPT